MQFIYALSFSTLFFVSNFKLYKLIIEIKRITIFCKTGTKKLV